MAKKSAAAVLPPLWERYSPEMKRVHHRLRAEGGLQAYLEREVPRRGLKPVAKDLQVGWRTLYRWVDLLFVRGKGPHLIPIVKLQQEQEQIAAAAAEAEQQLAVAELAAMRSGTEG